MINDNHSYIMPEPDIDLLSDLADLKSRYEEFKVYTDAERTVIDIINKALLEKYKTYFFLC